MNTVELDMKLTAADALEEWDAAGSDEKCSKARRDALYRRWQVLRRFDGTGGTPPPVSYVEGSAGPSRSLIREQEPIPATARATEPIVHFKAAKLIKVRAPRKPKSEPNPAMSQRPPAFTAAQMQAIASRIKEATAELGYDAPGGTSQLAQRIDCAVPSLSQARTGSYVSAAMLDKLATVGISAHWLRTGEGPKFAKDAVRFEAKIPKAGFSSPTAKKATPPRKLEPSPSDSRGFSRRAPRRDSEDGLDALVASLQAALQRRGEVKAEIKDLCARIATLS